MPFLSTLRLPLPLPVPEPCCPTAVDLLPATTLVSMVSRVFTDQRVRVETSGVRHEAVPGDDVLHATLRKSSDTKRPFVAGSSDLRPVPPPGSLARSRVLRAPDSQHVTRTQHGQVLWLHADTEHFGVCGCLGGCSLESLPDWTREPAWALNMNCRAFQSVVPALIIQGFLGIDKSWHISPDRGAGCV